MKNNYDSKYVSAELHEMKYIAKKFTTGTDNVAVQTLYTIYFPMQQAKKKVLRSEFYSILNLMGYVFSK